MQLQRDQERAVLARGSALGARRCFTGWYTTHGTGREVGGRVCAHARACLWGCARVRARDSVCYNIRVSLSWTLQFLILGQALGFTLPKDLLHHLVLVSSNKPGQAARQQHPDQLWECNSKSNSSYNSHICLHKTGHQIVTALLVYFSGSNGHIAQILSIAVTGVHATACRDAMFEEVRAGAPVGIALNATAAQTFLYVIHCMAPLIILVVILDCFSVCPKEGILDLRGWGSKNKPQVNNERHNIWALIAGNKRIFKPKKVTEIALQTLFKVCFRRWQRSFFTARSLLTVFSKWGIFKEHYPSQLL